MKGLSTSKIPIATDSYCHLDLTCDHVTTMNFGEFQPVHYRHMIIGEHINLAGAGTIRPFPLACPTFGRMRCNIHHFFVPFRLVFPQWNSFYNNKLTVNYGNVNLITSAPSVTNSTLATLLLSHATEIENWTDAIPYDFFASDNKHYRFTRTGKFFYKVLCSLGYAINFDLNDDIDLSALPLLAYCKIFIDYYANQAYLNSADVLDVMQLLAYNNPSQSLELTASQIDKVFSLIRYCQYEQDYFVGAWDNPFAPTSQQYSGLSFNDVVTGLSVALDATGTPYMKQANATSTNVGSEYMHDVLKAITDYQKRHQLAGASNINRSLAQFGFVNESVKLDRAIHLAGSSIDVQTGAVFSTANTSAGISNLGDYAGNGYGNGVSNFDFKCDEAGIQITIASVIPSGGYYQGMDENNMHVNRFDFWTPEMDGLSTQVLRRREVYVSRNSTAFASDSGYYDENFAHVSRYGEYKRPRYWVSGDYRCPTRFSGGHSWHLMREFTDGSFNDDVENIKHSLEFTRYIDNDSYRRIFTMTKTDNDPFFAEFHWSVGSYAPCHGLFDNYEFDSQGQKKVTIEGNGAIVN